MSVNLIDVDLNHTWSQPGMKGKQKRKILPQLKNCIYKCTRIFENEKSDNNIYFLKLYQYCLEWQFPQRKCMKYGKHNFAIKMFRNNEILHC